MAASPLDTTNWIFATLAMTVVFKRRLQDPCTSGIHVNILVSATLGFAMLTPTDKTSRKDRQRVLVAGVNRAQEVGVILIPL